MLSAKARSKAKLPICAMWGNPDVFFQKPMLLATGGSGKAGRKDTMHLLAGNVTSRSTTEREYLRRDIRAHDHDKDEDRERSQREPTKLPSTAGVQPSETASCDLTINGPLARYALAPAVALALCWW